MTHRHDRPRRMLKHRDRHAVIDVEVFDPDALARAVESGELDPVQERVARLLLQSLMDEDED